MTRAERLLILGPEAAAEARQQAAAAPPPSPEQLAVLRRIFAAFPQAARQRAA